MKITIVSPIYPPEIGGPATYVPEMAIRLGKKHLITVVTFCGTKPKKTKNVTVIGVPLFGFFILRQLRLFIATFRSSLSSEVIYAQGTVTVGLTSLIVAKLLRKKFFLKFVGDEIWENYRNSSEHPLSLNKYYSQSSNLNLVTWLHKVALQQADGIITPSRYLKNFLVNTHTVSSKKIYTISNPVSIPKTKKTTKKQNQLLYVGRLVTWKNVDMVIKSLFAKKTKWNLLIVGDGPEKGPLMKLATSLAVTNRVTFTGALSKSETLKKISESSALVLLSDYEGQSHTLIESLSLKTPVIVSDIIPNRELVEKNGRYVSLKKPNELVGHLKNLVFVRDSVASYYRLNHSWNSHLDQLVKVFTKGA